ncbi:hypothetical protein Pint_21451 [Pistacia integerrima]|uniref:Uncharacterized protein n=1 Tax=Pistacia integerrima TaxID=434235 RepID=A0ACC0XDU6_9ROSI|nr:hypothetical protein Pint_21451 [Pistacia integerrima]
MYRIERIRVKKWVKKSIFSISLLLRAPKSEEGYAFIGSGSPLWKIKNEQVEHVLIFVILFMFWVYLFIALVYFLLLFPNAHALKMALEAKNLPVNIYVGMSYWYPFTEEAVQQIKGDRITRPVVLPLYPQFSISTTGSSIRVLERIFRSDGGYLLMQNLKDRGVGNDHTLEYQSRVGPVQWLKPYTDEVLVELGQRGVKSLLAIPVCPYGLRCSFVSEHIETLEEIDMEYRELALQSGIQNSGRVPAPELNLFLHHGSGRCSTRSLTCRNRHVFRKEDLQ